MPTEDVGATKPAGQLPNAARPAAGHCWVEVVLVAYPSLSPSGKQAMVTPLSMVPLQSLSMPSQVSATGVPAVTLQPTPPPMQINEPVRWQAPSPGLQVPPRVWQLLPQTLWPPGQEQVPVSQV